MGFLGNAKDSLSSAQEAATSVRETAEDVGVLLSVLTAVSVLALLAATVALLRTEAR